MPVTGLAVVRRCRDIRAHITDHRGPQAPLGAAPPLARELEVRVAVAGKTYGLGGQVRFKLNRCRIWARVSFFRWVMLAVGCFTYLASIH